MLHPSYTELIQVVNGDLEDGETPVVNSRYSIVLATAKRARQIIDGSDPMSIPKVNKPLSIAVDELQKGLLKIQGEEVVEEEIMISESGMGDMILDEEIEEELDEEAEEEIEE